MENKIIYEVADQLIQEGVVKANDIEVPMVFAIMDVGGNLVSFKRMAGSLLISTKVAQGKAYTAAALNMTTEELSKIITPGQPIYGMEMANPGMIIPFGGGYPLYYEGELIGGLGVSGGSCEEDMECAIYAIEHVDGITTK